MKISGNHILLTQEEYKSILSTIDTLKVEMLLLKENNEALKAEIRLLKDHPKKPNIKPGNLEKPKPNEAAKTPDKRAGSEKQKKTKLFFIKRRKLYWSRD